MNFFNEEAKARRESNCRQEFIGLLMNYYFWMKLRNEDFCRGISSCNPYAILSRVYNYLVRVWCPVERGQREGTCVVASRRCSRTFTLDSLAYRLPEQQHTGRHSTLLLAGLLRASNVRVPRYASTLVYNICTYGLLCTCALSLHASLKFVFLFFFFLAIYIYGTKVLY